MADLPRLRPYQVAIGRAVRDSIRNRRGLTFTVEMSRQGGKNELSAQLELLHLTRNLIAGGSAVKCAPTFDPQCLFSLARLEERLNDEGFHQWTVERGSILRLGRARQVFMSAAKDANVVGATADLLLEVDEAQDVDKDKYQKEFRPMASTANATTVLYGTPWDANTLLEQQKQSNLELEAKDGIQRHFRYDWIEVSQHNPAYKAFAEAERDRLGEDHPLFKTQYALETVDGNNTLFSAQQRAWLQGSHPRQHAPSSQSETYVAGIDIAGEATTVDTDYNIRTAEPARDSTVVTIARVIRGAAGFPSPFSSLIGPRIEILDHLWLTGRNHADLLPTLANLLNQTWHCYKIVVDATGMGQGLASMLQKLLGSRTVQPFTFTTKSKSELGFNLLAAINANRLKLYQQDGSLEYAECMTQLDHAQARYRPNQTMDFHVDPRDGHDDFLSSLALTVEAANLYEPRVARGYVR